MWWLEQLRTRVAAWPVLTRDAGAAALVLAGIALAQLLILASLPVEIFLAAPGVLAALVIFGRKSTLFAALLTAAAVAVALDPAARVAVWNLPAISTAALALGCLAFAFGVAGLAASAASRARAATRERRAKALMDACARDAVSQIEAAGARLARAEAEIVEARQQLARAKAAARSSGTAPPHDPLEDALRSEGGV
ncbi:hypothetical protein [Roseicella aerolata]|uniref:Histidine kinase n=1 Tax=Roseicella aerolata TaxID=2883479 RepID=A0A9X1IGN3_9PROT|nr:hypothetical protein [Roseicella aerolata]MCB4822725.1 hypothetical protein [Roseicella aerolata]